MKSEDVTSEWTLEQVMEVHRAYQGPSRTSPLFRWVALTGIDEHRKQYEQGNDFALMLAIRKCANHDLIMPAWVAEGFIRGFDKVLGYHVKSWDEAFGAPFPKGTHIKAQRKRRDLMFAVHSAVDEIRMRDCDQAIDSGLFEKVGEMFDPSLGKTLAEEYYYAAHKLLYPKG